MHTIDFSSHDIDVSSILYSAPGYIYWKDLNLLYLGCNRNFLDIVGLKDINDLIGKTDYDMPWGKYPEMVEKYGQDDRYVIKTGNKLLTEDQSLSLQDNTKIIVQTAKTPLINKFGKTVGVLGIAIDITNIKEAERLKLENQTQNAELKAQEEFKDCLENIQYAIQSYKIHVLNKKLGVKPHLSELTEEISLTKRERAVLYYLSLNKSPKEIAGILTFLDQKKVAPNTIQSIINKQLYPKFKTFNMSHLIEKANMLRLIPCLPDN